MSSLNVARKLIESHLESGEMMPGEEIALHIDQTLNQDATGTLVMQELEAVRLDRARTEVSVQYADQRRLAKRHFGCLVQAATSVTRRHASHAD
jgi:aconitate hydratase